METKRRFTGKARISRDTVLLIFGMTGIAYQQLTGEVYEPLVWVFGAMAGLPGVQALTDLLPRRGGREEGTTASSSSPSPSPSSPDSSPHT